MDGSLEDRLDRLSRVIDADAESGDGSCGGRLQGDRPVELVTPRLRRVRA
jgi:hypothetical protein